MMEVAANLALARCGITELTFFVVIDLWKGVRERAVDAVALASAAFAGAGHRISRCGWGRGTFG